MELHAYTKNLNEIFSLNKKYVVPRFQREYSWKKEEINEFWDDITSYINPAKKSSKVLKNEDYFIGSLVLIGDDASFEHSIVDGQQRLTTLTILIRSLADAFMTAGEDKIGKALYDNYIEGTDNDGKKYFKLINETPKPYFQSEIQYINPENQTTPTTEEEKLLHEAFLFFKQKLEEKQLLKNYPDTPYAEALKSIRKQILNHLKFIYINVKKEEDAYAIFETLNARGMSLSSVDLIKNWIFKKIKKSHPSDTARETWKRLNNELCSRTSAIDIDTFFRHHWNSKYGYSSEDRIYKSFKSLTKNGEITDAKEFLNTLLSESQTYNKICNPLEIDWKGQTEKGIYNSLSALNLFKVSQTRPFLLALLESKSNIKTPHLLEILKSLENFHFIFTAVCSSRASGLDGKYAKSAKEIRNCTSKTESKDILNDLIESLKQKIPSESIFIESFSNLWFCKDHDKDKRLIQYIFGKIESYHHNQNELKINEFSLEHIQDQRENGDWMGCVGNLIPLAIRLNNEIPSNSSFTQKLVHYKRSTLSTVESFVQEVESKNIKIWTEENIIERTNEIARQLYQSVMTIEKIK